MKALVVTLVSIAALATSQVLGGPPALGGAILGVCIGGMLSFVNQLFIMRARRACGQGLVGMVMGGALVSVVVLGLTVVLLGLFWRPTAIPAGLTALVVYLTYKLWTAAEVTRELWRKPHKIPCPPGSREAGGEN